MLGLASVALSLFALQNALQRHAPRATAVLITEICAHNGTGIRERMGSLDWIELYNAGFRVGEPEGWHLTDSFLPFIQGRFPKSELALKSIL